MKKLLVVDDDRFIRTLIKTILAGRFDITEAENGRELVNAALREKPDLIVTDIVMPVMSGYRAIGRLQKEPGFEAVPVIFTSSAVSDRDIYEMYKPESMPSAFINKPFAKTELINMVDELLSGGSTAGSRY